MRKPWPVLKSDSEAEDFVATADLTEYDFGQMVPMAFEHKGRDRAVTMSLPAHLFHAIAERAKVRGMPFERFVLEVLERAIERDSP